MKRQELHELRMELLKIYSNKRASKEVALYKKILALISYTEDLKHSMKAIAKIGGDHHL